MFTHSFSVQHSLKKLFLQRYERYLPTAFDESMSLLEKMNKLIESQNSIIDVVNTHTEFTSEQLERAFKIVDDNLANELKKFRDELVEQKTQYEEIRDLIHSDLLPDSVAQKMEEWMLNGTIENMLTDTVFPELMERIEQVENRVEERELLDEVNILDYKDFVVDDNWHDAIQLALSESRSVIFPNGHYKTFPIVSNLSDRAIIGRGNGTTFEFVRETPTGLVGGFRIEGDMFDMYCETVRRVTRSVIPGDDKVYLEKTEGLNVGDKIKITSQRDSFSYEDAGNDWLLGKPTASQKVPFGEYADILEVYSDHIVLSGALIYPQYQSSNAGEVNPVNDFSFVEKVNFVSNWQFKDFKVTDMVSGYVVRPVIAHKVTLDNIHFDDSNYSYGQTGIFSGVNCLDCEVRNSSHYLPVDNKPIEYYWTNSLKLVASQNSGFVGCFTENAGQSVDLTYLSGNIPNTACYITGCRFINSKQSAMTTHGGNYLTQITNNKFIGSPQGMNHRGRGGIITGNIMVGNSKNSLNSTLTAGVALYEGGSCDNLVSGNSIRGYTYGVVQRDGSQSNGRIGVASNTISNNIIKDCSKPIHIYRLYTGANYKPDNMGVMIANNQISLINNINKDSVYAIHIDRAVVGVTVRGNIIKGPPQPQRESNFYGVRCEGDANEIRVLNNSFYNLAYGVSHPGAASPSRFPDGMILNRESNEYLNVYQASQVFAPVRPYSDEELRG